uniref:Malonate--CoA ligase-like n=1 Tax=Nicotiana tabacum TaxID=4097 RepID=A0A1S4BXH4_TOBAC
IAGHRLLEYYGMTEFVMAISNPIRGKCKGGTVGKPFSAVLVKLGELCIKSPSLFKEYWKLPEVTNQSFTDDGFFRTGDDATVDEDGCYIILGRANSDIMKVGGYKFSALEIVEIEIGIPSEPSSSTLEQNTVETPKVETKAEIPKVEPPEILARFFPWKHVSEKKKILTANILILSIYISFSHHPAISECCAVCEIVVPYSELKGSRDEELKLALRFQELSDWAKERLAPYKIPRLLLVWYLLPRNATGKVNKKELKEGLAYDL